MGMAEVEGDDSLFMAVADAPGEVGSLLVSMGAVSLPMPALDVPEPFVVGGEVLGTAAAVEVDPVPAIRLGCPQDP